MWSPAGSRALREISPNRNSSSRSRSGRIRTTIFTNSISRRSKSVRRIRKRARKLAAFQELARTEGILPALEPAHALARARDLDAELILVGLSGRGDKDLAEALAAISLDRTSGG